MLNVATSDQGYITARGDEDGTIGITLGGNTVLVLSVDEADQLISDLKKASRAAEGWDRRIRAKLQGITLT